MANRRWIRNNKDLGVGPVPVEPCISEEFFQLERERVFRRLWVNIAREDELPEPGDFIVRELAVCDASILLIRGKDRVIRAFHNVCTHRGNRLVREEKGSCKSLLTCRFHSWAFDSQGALKWVSDEDNFYDIDKGELGLKAIHADSWQGFVFINLADSPEQTLAEYLEGVVGQLAEFPFNAMRLMFRYRVEEEANWKVILDAQNEVYHIPFLHLSTYPDFCPTNQRNFSRILDFRRFGRHTVYSVEFNSEHKLSPIEAIAIRTQPAAPESGSSRIGWFDFYTIFPNFCVLFPPGACITYNISPLSVNRAIWEITFYQLPPQRASERFSLEYWRCRNRDLLQEDASNHEAVQSSLKSRAISHFMMQDEEIQLRHFHKVLREEVAR